jgi:hypothetical protein
MAFKLSKSVFMFLGQGGHKDGVPDNPDRAYVIFVSARNVAAAEKEAHTALNERGWNGVDILRGAEASSKPDQKPHDDAWQEAREGRRGIVVYDTKAGSDTAGANDTPAS